MSHVTGGSCCVTVLLLCVIAILIAEPWAHHPRDWKTDIPRRLSGCAVAGKDLLSLNPLDGALPVSANHMVNYISHCLHPPIVP